MKINSDSIIEGDICRTSLGLENDRSFGILFREVYLIRNHQTEAFGEILFFYENHERVAPAPTYSQCHGSD